jgi:hypothetical protein
VRRTLDRLGWAAAGALGITLVLVLAGVVSGGPLDPPGAPSSSMRTLEEVPPAWDRFLSSNDGCTSRRWKCVFNTGAPDFQNLGALDRETGLVWERDPSGALLFWTAAVNECATRSILDRMGWRLPTLDELTSLVDTSQTAPTLPNGHPFNVAGGFFWTSTSSPSDNAAAYQVAFSGEGGVLIVPKFSAIPGDAALAWCVRGGGNSQTGQ